MAKQRLHAAPDKQRMIVRTLAAIIALTCGGLLAAAAHAVSDMTGGPSVRELNFQPPATSIAAEVYDLHLWMVGLCMAIFMAVFGTMLYAMLRHRQSQGHKAAIFSESLAVEMAWTVVPFLIVVLMALPATRIVLAMKDTTNADVTIKATGTQWKWGYQYLKGEGEGLVFFSSLSTPRAQIYDGATKGENYLLEVDHPLVVPVNKKIRIITTATDVIHAWGIPAFSVKQDAIPGFIRDTWFRAERPGIYRGGCYELCGKEHAFMPIVVQVVSGPDYTRWVAEEKTHSAAYADNPNKRWNESALSARGEKVYAANCVPCHQVNGKGLPGTFPALDGSALVNGPQEAQIAVVLNGRKGMPAWKGVLSDTDIAAVITYTRQAWSNRAADTLVQPAQVKQARGQ